jgi:chain length determinant protein EpsF
MQLQDFWRIISERRKIVLLAFITTVVTTLVGSLFLPAKYESTATIMLDYDSSNPMNMSMVMPQAVTSVEYVNTQIEIIKSRRIAEGVVDYLKIDKVPDIIEKFNRAKEGNPLFFWRTQKEMEIKRWLADEFLSKYLKVEPARDSRFLYIKYYSPDPVFSASVANAFAKSYNDYNLELKVSPFKAAGKWFSEKIKDAKGQSDKASEQLRAYQQKKGIIAQQGSVYDDALQRLDQINKELATAKARLYETKVALKRLEDSNGNYESLPEVLSNSFVQGLKTEKVKLETQLTELSGKAGTKHPQYIRLKSMLEALNAKLSNEMQTIVSALRQDNLSAVQRVSSLESAVESLKKQSTATNLSRFELDSYNRESESSKQAYDLVLKKFSESAMQSDINRTNIFLVDAAVPAIKKHSPKIVLNLALSLFVGLFLGIGLAMFFDYLDDTIKSAEMLERHLGLTVLGVITSSGEI